MPEQTVIKSSFIGSFKLGDNIVYNLDVLRILYKVFESVDNESQKRLCKPIIIIIASITEALLYDFHMKAKNYFIEGIRGVSDSVISYIRGKNIDEFEKYISSARKHEVFGSSDDHLYTQLEELRKLRNRVHIQNTKNHFEPDDIKAFSLQRKINAEWVLEGVLRIMEKNHSRGRDYVNDFILPWAPRH